MKRALAAAQRVVSIGVERLETRQVCGHQIAIAMHEVAGPSTVIFCMASVVSAPGRTELAAFFNDPGRFELHRLGGHVPIDGLVLTFRRLAGRGSVRPRDGQPERLGVRRPLCQVSRGGPTGTRPASVIQLWSSS